MKYIRVLLILLCLSYASTVFADENITINMEVNNIPSSNGNIIIYFCQNEEEFLSEKQTQYSFFFPAKKDKVRAKIIRPKGTYAIHLYHDENDNKKIDKNSSNHPTEYYGFSNNFFGSYGKLPAFKNVQLNIDKDEQFIKINLRN